MSRTLIKKLKCGCATEEVLDHRGETYFEVTLCDTHAKPRTMRALLQKVLDSADDDWWAERDDMTRSTPFDVTLTAGLLWDIDEILKRGV